MNTFLKEAITSFKTTGALRPSSKELVHQIIKDIDFTRVKTVIEFGPGDGCITQAIADRLSTGAKLLSFEINERFYELCTDIFAQDQRVSIVNRSALDFIKVMQELHIQEVDCIVSSIPLALLPPVEVESLLQDVRTQLRPEASFIQYQYSLGQYKRLKRIFDQVKINFTLLNLPPAFIYKCNVVK